jgi:Fe-S cluster assembly iron-binding protein IscA
LAMDIAKAAQAGDTTIELNGLKIFLEERANAMLMNTNIDFQENQGFVLSGMQPSSCGSSCSTC